MTPHEQLVNDKTRIVVTGMGMVSPYGKGVDTFLDGIRSGEGAIREIEDFDVSACRCKSGARVPAMDMQQFDPSGTFRRAPRATQYSVIATDEALRQAGHETWGFAAERVGVFLGTYRGMTEVSEQIWSKLIDSEPRFVPALLFQETVTNAVASAISIRWGFRGTNYAISSGNSSGFQVLHLAAEALREGRADAIVAGTFDLFTQANQHDMDDLGLLSATGASRPFAETRDGFVMGEGAAVVVLETLASAKQRGATVLAEIAGLGLAHDAYGFAQNHPEGRGLAAAIRKALAKGDTQPADIDYIGAAANSTTTLDQAERAAIDLVFGDNAATVPVSSLKGMTGEAMAASDMFNLIACIGAIRDSIVPVHAGADEVEGMLNLVGADAQPREVRTVLANSYSYFGGNAGAALLRSCPN
ncbi:MAG TPA: beta-ketoacyl-[acyl-carrier-protein] synthase family protein [Thermoanaerobaculia bacterium]|jgi:3-oxoacyl-(acyl-carrier-protein) synthase